MERRNPPLSEKAKGKQKADSADVSEVPLAKRELTIRFTEGVHDMIVSVGEKDSVRDIKAKV